MKKTLQYLQAKKSRGEKITMLTCYDYPTARWEEDVGVDIIFVGDSVGTNLLGYDSEREVTMDDMLHHLKAVRRGVEQAYLLVDMPFGTYDSPDQALSNARTFLEYGADAVKIEGPKVEQVRFLKNSGIEVCVHLGLTLQTETRPGFRAKTASAAVELCRQAFALEHEGASLILFEMVPEEVAKYLTELLKVPTIGIGAGRFTDGQVSVVLDVLGLGPSDFRHNRKYEDFRKKALCALRTYLKDVATGQFPGEENLRHMTEAELRKFSTAMEALRPNDHR